MRRILFLLLLWSYSGVFAQNITVIEYFFDTDPGYGSGTAVAITPAPVITNLTFNTDISTVSNGFHTLFLRAKDANGNWSIPYSQTFYKVAVSASNPAPNINKLEYFIDADPGYGAGADVSITAGVSILNQGFTIPLSSTANGFHSLTVRTRDANGNWSIGYKQPFYKTNVTTLPNINKLEYFIDADPGYGAGVDVPVTAAISISNLSVIVPVSSVSVGSHIITFRARDANGSWSIVVVQNFNLCNEPAPVAGAATGITSSGFTANWPQISGSIGYQIDVSTDNFATFVSGYNAKAIIATASSASVTGLTQATTYQYRLRSVASCVSVPSNTITLTTPATPPSAQPTNLLFSSVTTTSLTTFFTAASPPPTGYLMVRKIGSSPTFLPADNVSYIAGQAAGDAVVVSVGSSLLFNETGLSPYTHYYYNVFAYNQAGGYISYLTASPLSNNVTTVASEPTAQATNLQFTSVSSTGFSVNFTAATGNPGGYLVLRKAGSAPVSVPADGVTYTTTVGTDAVAYQGGAATFTESGLTQNTNYYYAIYAFNGSSTSINYITTSPLQGNQLTPVTPPSSPSGLVFNNVTPSSLTVAYTAPTVAPSGYLVIRKVEASSSFVPVLNTSYSIGQVLSDGTVAYFGSALTFNESGLTASTTYFYDVFAYNQIGSLISYQTLAPLAGSKITFTAEPTSQASTLAFSAITTTTLHLSFSPASSTPSGYLVLRGTNAAPTSTPADGTPYTIGNTTVDGTVAFVGSNTSFDDSGLLPGTTYYYQVFSFNGSGSATNYLATVNASNSGSVITVPDKPVTINATGVQQNLFTANWVVTTGATNYRLDVSKDNFVTRVSGFDDLTVNATSVTVTGLETGTAYQYRVRAVNGGGTSVNSDPNQQSTVPATPAFAASSDVTQTSFTANWDLVTGASNYFIDVANDGGFASILANYNNLPELSTANSLSITGLTAGTTYYFRIRSNDSGGTSPSSIAEDQLLKPATPVGSDATNTTQTSFKAKWQAATGANEYRLDVSLASDNFNPSLSNNTDISVVGNIEYLVVQLAPNTAYEYRIRAVNPSGTSPSSLPISVSTLEAIPNGGNTTYTIPFPTGGQVTDYRIMSIPQGTAATTNLTDATYQKNWRIMHYNNANDKNDDVRDVSTIAALNGYWINSNINGTPVIQTTGTYVSTDASIILQPKWNQIGNPFDFNISWADVLSINSGVTNVGNLITYNVPVSASSPWQEHDGLDFLGGGYVNNANSSPVTLKIPTTVKHSTGRVASNIISAKDLSGREWYVPLSLKVGSNINDLGGFGMHPESNSSFDRYDAIALPYFFTYVDLSSNHPEFFQPSFMRDVVTSDSKYDWTFLAASNSDDRQTLLSWDNSSFGNNSAQLILYDVTSGVLVDMKKNSSYSFQLNSDHSIRFFYSSDGTLSPDITGIGQPYPNPFNEKIIIPFVTRVLSEDIQIGLYDMMGKQVRALINTKIEPGYHEAQWDGSDDQGSRVASGIYIYRFTSSDSLMTTGKIILK